MRERLTAKEDLNEGRHSIVRTRGEQQQGGAFGGLCGGGMANGWGK